MLLSLYYHNLWKCERVGKVTYKKKTIVFAVILAFMILISIFEIKGSYQSKPRSELIIGCSSENLLSVEGGALYRERLFTKSGLCTEGGLFTEIWLFKKSQINMRWL